MIKVPLKVPNHSYDIYIGQKILGESNYLKKFLGSDAIIILSNTTVASLHLNTLKENLNTERCFEYILPDGESEKNLKQFEAISTFMLQKKLDRRTVLIALGGGVVGDLGGFVAACYQRGIRYIQVPTTLLAQVDSSVGGKTAINHSLGKNMIGAFHQPSLVLSDTSLLETLPEREFISGIAEVIKYGLIKDYLFFEWLEKNIEHIMSRSPEALATVIRKSCENKRDVVSEDEKERGIRAILNLGHTFGHAIEKLTNYGSWLHGEAVAVGICMASRLSRDQGLISDESYSRIESIFKKANLPTRAPTECSPDRMIEIMQGDKKSSNKEINLVLLREIGDAFLTRDYSDALLKQILDSGRKA